MNIFNFREKKFFFIWFITLVLIIFQIIPQKNQDNFLFKLVYKTLGGVQTMSVNFHLEVKDVLKKYLFLLHLQEENSKLRQGKALLEIENQILKELQEENSRLKKLLNLSQAQKRNPIVAQVIANDFLSQNELIVINKGSRQGIKKYMGVLHTKGVVGYVFRVSPYSSQVISLHNKLSSLPARFQKSRLKGLIEGRKDLGLLHFKYFKPPRNQKLSTQTGDVIVTSSSLFFPSGIPVGEAIHVQKNNIQVKPYVDVSQIEEVFVLLTPEKQGSNDE